MSLENQKGVIWLDGKFVPWQEANVHCLTHTLHYGVGVFEGVRAYKTDKGTAIFRLQDHTDRLFRSAKIINMKINFAKDELNFAQQETVKQNKLNAAYIRPMVFYGAEYLGLQTNKLSTHVMIAAWDWNSFLGDENAEKGIKVRTSSFMRNSINSTLCKAKANGNYINSVLAFQEAIASGCDEALLLDHQGCVAEGSGENIFMVRDGVLYTPDLTVVIEGITRDTIIQLAAHIGLSVKEKRITRDELYIADEAFFTGTAAEVMPIREIDDRIIGNGKCGEITTQLQKMYIDMVHGKSKQYKKWLSFI